MANNRIHFFICSNKMNIKWHDKYKKKKNTCVYYYHLLFCVHSPHYIYYQSPHSPHG